MSEERQEPWMQMEGEPNLWYDRYTMYRLLGPKRSIHAAHRQEAAKRHKTPQYLPGGWDDAARQWHWKERAEAWDAQQREILECEVDQVLSDGLALMHERVRALKKRAVKLDKKLDKDERISAHLLEQWRGLLSDIADELGQRVKTTKSEITGKDGESLTTQVVVYLPENGRDKPTSEA